MICVDTRAGSKDLIEPLRAAGLVVEGCRLTAGDVEWVGRGPKGAPVLVGVEYKKWADLLTCMRDGRFAEQVRGMAKCQDYRWLLVEGRIRPGKKGVIEEPNRGGGWAEMHGHYTYQEAAAWITTMASRAGVLVWRTESFAETVAWLRAQYLWWTAKDWEEHRAHLDFYQPRDAEQFVEPSVVQLMAMALPGVGTAKAVAIASEFDSPLDMATAEEERWRKIDGIGKTMAERLVAACRGSAVLSAGSRSRR